MRFHPPIWFVFIPVGTAKLANRSEVRNSSTLRARCEARPRARCWSSSERRCRSRVEVGVGIGIGLRGRVAVRIAVALDVDVVVGVMVGVGNPLITAASARGGVLPTGAFRSRVSDVIYYVQRCG